MGEIIKPGNCNNCEYYSYCKGRNGVSNGFNGLERSAIKHGNIKLMTVKEISKILNVSSEAIKKHVRRLFPYRMKNGKTTYLSEKEITMIKKNMTPTTQVVANRTALEENEIVMNKEQLQKKKLDYI